MVATIRQPRHTPMDAAIPVINFGPYIAGVPGALDAAAAELRYALEHIGFFLMINHGVPPELIEQTFAEARRFHTLPLVDKMALRMNEHNNGYMSMSRYAVWTSEVNTNTRPDLNEAFFIKRERAANDPLCQSGRRFVGPNRWPANLPGFRENVLTYTAAMDTLTARVLPVCAAALDLSPDYFQQAFRDSQFSFRLSHYPPVRAEENQFGIAPHTDANFLTFLAQTEVPGLQVRLPSGDWYDVPYVPGSYAVNSGDMLYRWSNARFKSTPHRAIPPVGQHRYAIPFFLGPHIDTVIECLPTCQDQEHPPKFPPITYEAYLHWWYDANYPAALQNTTV